MSGPTHVFGAKCTTCKAAYHTEVISSQRKRVKAAAGNQQVWMQTHRDTTGHARFWCEESVRSYRIIGTADPRQITIMEDENFSTFRL